MLSYIYPKSLVQVIIEAQEVEEDLETRVVSNSVRDSREK